MASQLSLRIQSQLDKAGFEQFKQAIREFTDGLQKATGEAENLRNAMRQVGGREAVRGVQQTQASFTQLGGTLRNIGGLLAGVFATSGLREITGAAIESERQFVQLQNRLELLGEDAELSARRVFAATEQLGQTTQFSQTQLLDAVNILLRTAGSSDEALRRLTVVQDLAAASGRGLAGAAVLLNQAQLGMARGLTQVTGLTATQIRQYREEGTLIEEVGKKVRGFAERDLATLGGQIANVNARFEQTKQAAGEDFLSIVEGAVGAFKSLPSPVAESAIQIGILGTAFLSLGTAANLLKGAAGPVLAVLGKFSLPIAVFSGLVLAINAVQAALKGSEQRADLAADALNKVKETLQNLEQDGPSTFSSISAEIAGTTTTLSALDEQLERINEELAEQARLQKSVSFSGQAAEQQRERVQSLEQERDRLGQTISRLKERQQLLTRAEAAGTKTKLIDVEKEQENIQKLLLGEQAFAQQKLRTEQQLLETRLSALSAESEEREKIITRLAAISIELSRRELDVRLEKLEREKSLRQEILGLFERTIPELPEGADEGARSNQLDRILQLRDARLETIREVSEAEQQANRALLAEGKITQEEFERRERKRIRETADAEIQARQDIQQRLEEIGSVEGRADVEGRERRRLDTLQREQRNRLRRDLGEGEVQIAANEEEQLRDAAAEAAKKAVELERFRVEVNLNLDRGALRAEMAVALDTLLRDRGFRTERTSVAPAEGQADGDL